MALSQINVVSRPTLFIVITLEPRRQKVDDVRPASVLGIAISSVVAAKEV